MASSQTPASPVFEIAEKLQQLREVCQEADLRKQELLRQASSIDRSAIPLSLLPELFALRVFGQVNDMLTTCLVQFATSMLDVTGAPKLALWEVDFSMCLFVIEGVDEHQSTLHQVALRIRENKFFSLKNGVLLEHERTTPIFVPVHFTGSKVEMMPSIDTGTFTFNYGSELAERGSFALLFAAYFLNAVHEVQGPRWEGALKDGLEAHRKLRKLQQGIPVLETMIEQASLFNRLMASNHYVNISLGEDKLRDITKECRELETAHPEILLLEKYYRPPAPPSAEVLTALSTPLPFDTISQSDDVPVLTLSTPNEKDGKPLDIQSTPRVIAVDDGEFDYTGGFPLAEHTG